MGVPDTPYALRHLVVTRLVRSCMFLPLLSMGAAAVDC